MKHAPRGAQEAAGAARSRSVDDETARLVLAVLWRLKAHLHGETPLPGGRGR